MPRWYIEQNDKMKLERLATNLSGLLGLPENLDQAGVMRLLMKHDEKILDVIVTAESVTNNGESVGRVPA